MSELSLIFKIAGIGVLVSSMNSILDGYGNKNMSTFVTMAGMVLACTLVVNEVYQFFQTVMSVFKLY